MTAFGLTLASAIVAFVFTNLDDLIILILFFGQTKTNISNPAKQLRAVHVIVGNW